MENQATKNPRILVVEPDPLILTGIAAILDMQGFRCFLSRDLTVAKKATESLAFDLFVLSIDGIESAEQMAVTLRTANETQDVPVVFMSERIEPGWHVRLNRVGGVYCVPKPVDPRLLVDLVHKAVMMPHLAQARLSPPKAHFAQDWVRL